MATKIHVIFYSMYGHVYRMAEAVAAGAREASGTEVMLFQVPELVPHDILEKTGAKGGAPGLCPRSTGSGGAATGCRCDNLWYAH